MLSRVEAWVLLMPGGAVLMVLAVALLGWWAGLAAGGVLCTAIGWWIGNIPPGGGAR